MDSMVAGVNYYSLDPVVQGLNQLHKSQEFGSEIDQAKSQLLEKHIFDTCRVGELINCCCACVKCLSLKTSGFTEVTEFPARITLRKKVSGYFTIGHKPGDF